MSRPSHPRTRPLTTGLVVLALLAPALPAAAAGTAPSAVVPAGVGAAASPAAPTSPAPGAPGAPAPVVQEVDVVLDDAGAGTRSAPAAGADAAAVVDASEATPLVADLDVAADRVATEAVRTSDDQTIGVTWPEGADGDALAVQVRTRTGDEWSTWTDLDAGGSPDAGTADAARARRDGTETLWVGDVDAVQLSFAASQAAPDDIRLALVGTPTTGGATDATTPAPTPSETPGATPGPSTPAATPEPGSTPATPAPTARPDATSPSPTATTAGAAARTEPLVRTASLGRRGASLPAAPASGTVSSVLATASSPPRVISRAEWGAPAQSCTPDVAGGLVGAVVHHTAGSNSYTSVAQAMQQIRNDAVYHMQSRGWCDIGYNFIVDKWGNVYEGRAGSMELPVIGVHAGGFNTSTLGVSMLGTYDAPPSEATQRAVGQIIGWRLGQYGVDPRASLTYHTAGGENARFTNQWVTLPRVFGHRDVSYTSCPGDGGYSTLPTIRLVAWDWSLLGREHPASSLMRTAENPSVYLVSGGRRYPISSLDVMSALSPLGPLSVVPRSYLDQWPVGRTVQRALLAPNGTVSFFDAGIRVAFTSCAQVADYGMDCGQAVPLEAAQLAQLHDGGTMTNLYRTTSGKAFWVDDGVRREIADEASLQRAQLPTAAVWLLESGIGYLPYGDPVVRPGLLLRERGGSRAVVVGESRTVGMPAALSAVPGLGTGASAELDPGSIARLRTDVDLAPFVVEEGTGTTWFLTDAGRAPVRTEGIAPSSPPQVPSAVLAGVPQAPPVERALFLKSTTSGTVFAVRGGTLLPIRAWDDLVHLNGGPSQPLTIQATTPGIVGLLPVGDPYDAPGTLAYAPSDGTVYLVDGDTHRVAVSTFSTTQELGATRLSAVAAGPLLARTARPGVLRTTVTCGSRTYVGLGGSLYEIGSGMRAHWSQQATTLHEETCALLPKASRPLTRFLRTPEGTIWWVDAGTKRPIGSWDRYLRLAGSADAAIAVSAYAAAQLPTGPAA